MAYNRDAKISTIVRLWLFSIMNNTMVPWNNQKVAINNDNQPSTFPGFIRFL